MPAAPTVAPGPDAPAFPDARTARLVGPYPWRPSVAELKGLVDRAQAHDPAAWEQLYRSCYPGLAGYARRRLWGRLEPDDAVSETFARAFRRIDHFHWTGGGFNGWLFGILRNVIFEMQRRDRRGALAVIPEPSWEDDVIDGVLIQKDVVAVRSAFATLSAGDQEVLELRVIAGLSADEVAAVVGKRAGAVRMAQSRALARLREALADELTSPSPNGEGPDG